jgi:3-methyladenine DNA glycosylase AlkD
MPRTTATQRRQWTLDEALDRLRVLGDPRNVEGMARFAISSSSTRVYGISVVALRQLAREIGRDHALAEQLWTSGVHEARHLACMVEEPAKITSAQLDRWVRDLDSWDVCDGFAYSTVSELPVAWRKVERWAKSREEFVRRAAFAAIAGLAQHDKRAPDADFMPLLALCEQYAHDDRNFVKKAVNWALRQVGKRNLALNRAAIATAERIQAQGTRPARWIAADALRELRSDAVRSRLRTQAKARG